MRTATAENRFTSEELQKAGITTKSVSEMLQSSHRGWLCEIDLQIVGFRIGNIQTGELWVIAVLPDFEGQGIGSQLLKLTEQLLWSCGFNELWLVTTNDSSLRAYSFYHSHRWTDAGVNGEDLTMKKFTAY